MTICTACESARETNPRLDEWASGCESCIARALAATGFNRDSVGNWDKLFADIPRGQRMVDEWCAEIRAFERRVR